MLKVENLDCKYKKFHLSDISFELDDGYIMTLLGANGAGKTTLLKLIYGMIKPEGGSVFWDELEVTGIKALDAKTADGIYYRDVVAYVEPDNDNDFDKKLFIKTYSVKKNVEMFSILYERYDNDVFENMLKKFEFPADKLDLPFGALSTGQRIQVMIAFCLARQPRLFIMDEPMANLDPVVKTDVWDVLSTYAREKNMSIIISTHLVEEVNDITDYVGILKDGEMTAFGIKDDLLAENGCESIRDLIRRLG